MKTIAKWICCFAASAWSAAALKLYFSISSEENPLHTWLSPKHLLFWCLFVLFLTGIYFSQVTAGSRRKEYFSAVSLIPSLGLTLLYTAGTILDYHSYAPAQQYAILAFCGIPGIFLFFHTLIYFFLTLPGQKTKYGRVFRVYEKHPIVITTGLLLLFWSPYLIFYFPGTVPFDGNFQLNMYFGIIPFTTHHPPLSTYLMGFLTQLGQSVGSEWLGVFLHTAFQTLLFAFAVSLSMQYCLRKKLPQWAVLAILLFFCFFPLFPVYAQAFMKDTVFTVLFLLFTILLIPFSQGKQPFRHCTALFFTALFLSLLRNNGIFVVLFTAIGFLPLSSGGKKQWILISAVSFAVTLGINAFLWPALGIEKGSKGEMLSLVLQPVAKYVKEYSEEITPEERESISKVLEYDGLGERYHPYLADPVKNTYVTDASADHLLAFSRTWFQLYQKHPEVFWSSFGNSTYSYWYPSVRTEPLLTFQLSPYHGENDAVNSSYSFGCFSEIRTTIREKLKQVASSKGMGILFRPGLYFWGILVLFLICLIEKRRKQLILFLPSATIWLTNIASPVAGSTRYTLPLMAVLPLLFAVVFTERAKKENQ